MGCKLNTFLAFTLMSSAAYAESPLLVKTEGRKAAKNLKLKSSKVPTFDLVQKKVVNGKVSNIIVSSIPRLDIGSEPVLEAPAFSPLRLPSSTNEQPKLKTTTVRTSPPLIDFKLKPYTEVVQAPKVVAENDAFQKIPDVSMLNPFPTTQPKQPHVELKDLIDMKPNDYKLLQALIFLEIQQNYEMAMGLFAELIDDSKHRVESLYNYALTAKGLGLNSEFRQYMVKVTQESKDKLWQERATKSLVENITVLEKTDIAIIDPLVAKFDVDVTRNDEYQITRAKYYSDIGKLGEMENALLFIDEKSKRYPDALLLNALFNYRQNKVTEATLYLDKLMDTTKGNKRLELRSVGALTLARMQFQQGQYKEAFKSYLLVDKSNPLWLQAMVESAWTQILSQDYEGAAGNMFSLHTDFFKNAFAPESYVVRTVGYLNLCQYGDGIQVLSQMKKKYSPWQEKLSSYQKAHPKTTDYYETLKTWVNNSDMKEIDGLPRSFIVELARHPAFTTVQSQINSYEDEISKFNAVALNMIKLDRQLSQKMRDAQSELGNVKRKVASVKPQGLEAKKMSSAERKLIAYSIQQHIARKAKTSIKDLRTQGIARIEKEKESLKNQASKALKDRFTQLTSSLEKVLSQTEVLQYEVYAGAGEHIRYQMAGGDISEKERPELKVEKEKSLNWNFKGEIWEDEVGHYRSSLKNVCPSEANIAGLNN